VASTYIDPAIAKHNRNEHLAVFVLTWPAIILVAALFLAPFLNLIFLSVYDDGFTMENYRRLWEDPIYTMTLWRTIWVSIVVTVTCAVLAYPIAFYAAMSRSGIAWLVLAFVLVPFWTSVLVRTYAWLVILQGGGLINRTLIEIGIIETPLRLVHNTTGTLIGMIHIMLPFIVLPLYSSLKQIPPEYSQASQSLGAGSMRTFLKIIFPLSLPGLAAGSIFVFVLSLGFYITPQLLGGGRVILISMVVARNVQMYEQFGAGTAVAVVLLVLIVVILWLLDRIIPIERIFGHGQ